MSQSLCPQCHNSKPRHLKFCSKTCSNRSRNLTSNSIEKAREHFLTKVRIPDDPDACWEWLASFRRDGYGQFKYQGKMLLAHRVAWMLFIGEIPDGLDVLHDPIHCHSRACTNYKHHLRPGTDQDNMDDRRIAGTHIEGSKRWNAKLTEEEVQQIRHAYHVLGIRPRDLAKQYGVHGSAIVKICKHDRWAHVPEPTAGIHTPKHWNRGAGNPASKLTEDQVREIRKIRKETGLSYMKISKQFGVSERVIWLICNGGAWTHIL